MELNAAGIKEQPFRTHGDPLHFVAFQAQADAERFLHNVCKHPHGLGLFQGPSLSGKTTILRHFAETLDEDRSVAIVNGSRRDLRALLDSILLQFGFSVKLDSVNEQLNMLRVYVTQQASCHSAPLLVVENTQTLNPDELQILCNLAELRTRHQHALRLVLSGDRCIAPIVRAPAMECIGKRLTGDFHLSPMEDYETLTYLHAKLRAGRCEDPASVLPESVCETIHKASGGWPGVVDRLVLLALARATSCPLKPGDIERPMVPPMTGSPGLQAISNARSMSKDSAKLFLTYNGKTIREVPFDRPRIMIGRSEHNDLPIVSRFISRHHAMFIAMAGRRC
jgi:general secretion pathway protein A